MRPLLSSAVLSIILALCPASLAKQLPGEPPLQCELFQKAHGPSTPHIPVNDDNLATCIAYCHLSFAP